MKRMLERGMEKRMVVAGLAFERSKAKIERGSEGEKACGRALEDDSNCSSACLENRRTRAHRTSTTFLLAEKSSPSTRTKYTPLDKSPGSMRRRFVSLGASAPS